ncbi:hypothetical protein [Streptomyces sp. NPDC090025]|uniref:hypothetical protein n=1 Tax=Streptomyces sp. NPDC090025 TaxID=3365922 RepID=UPI003832411D
MLGLFLAAAVLWFTDFLFRLDEPVPSAGYSALGLFAVPFVVALGSVVGAVLSAGLVLPAVRLGEFLARRAGGRAAWWHAALAALVTVPLALAAPFMGAAWWLAVGASLWGTVLLTARAGRGTFVTVLLWGTLGLLGVGAVGGGLLYADVIDEYAPPRMSHRSLTGVWADAEGGTLTLTADGRAVVRDIGYEGPAAADSFERDWKSCRGEGSWTFRPVAETWRQSVEIAVGGCALGPWEVGGTESAPTLYVYRGDPDQWDLYELRGPR